VGAVLGDRDYDTKLQGMRDVEAGIEAEEEGFD